MSSAAEHPATEHGATEHGAFEHRATVCSFNVHAAIDGWGRPFDPLPACLAADADVLFLAECFEPEAGEPEAGEPEAGEPGRQPSLRQRLVAEGGYELAAEAVLARVLRFEPPELAGRLAASWAPGTLEDPGLALLPADRPPRPSRRRRYRRRRPIRDRGTWQIVLLSRLPVRSAKVIPLSPLRREPLRRAVLRAEVEIDGSVLTVVGTHFPHLSAGSPLRVGELRAALPPASTPGVLMGDMNCFGPPLSLALPGWRRAVRGRTWPSWRPIAQPDHIFVSRGIAAAEGEVRPTGGSDHLPVRATLRW